MVAARQIPTPSDVANDARLFAATWLHVLTKDKRLTRLHYNPVQRHYMQRRTPRDLVLKARQFGFSTAIQGELFRLATTGTATTLTLSHEDKSTQKLRRITQRFYDNLPRDFRPARAYANATLTTYPGYDSECTVATAGNVNSGRGDSFSHIHGSEVAFWRDAESLLTAVLEAGSPEWVALESTPNGAQGWFYDACMEALDGRGIWRLHFYPWWSDSSYCEALLLGERIAYTSEEAALVELHNLTPGQIKWRRGKQKALKHKFLQEYPEDPRTCFLLSGQGYFGDVSHALSAPLRPTPQPGTRYVAGLDFGQTVDYTVLSVLNADTLEQVDLLRVNRLPWKDMRARVVERCAHWGVDLLVAERNSMGSTNIEALKDELRDAGCDTRLKAFDTTIKSKPPLIAGLHTALHESGLALLPDPAQRRELQAYEASQTANGNWTYGAPHGEHDDCVMALAIAWHALHKRPMGSIAVLDL